jgi:hypothetical protein
VMMMKSIYELKAQLWDQTRLLFFFSFNQIAS